MNVLNPWPGDIVTVGASEAELKRTQSLISVVQPKSHQEISSLEQLAPILDARSTEHPTLIRLFEDSHSKVLSWLGAGGRVSSEVAILGYADAIYCEPSEPPRVVGVFADAFVAALSSMKIACDTLSAALLIGACDETRAAAVGLARLGYKRIQVVDSDDEKTAKLIQILQRRVFGVKFEAVSRASLTQLPNESSLAFNLMGESERALLEDASYLNFLQKAGIWIDWTGATRALGYDEEIVDGGARVVEAARIRAWREVFLLSLLGSEGASPGQKPEQIADRLMAQATPGKSPEELPPS